MESVGEIYKKIYYDNEIRSIYKKIHDIEEANKNAWAHHDFAHVDNVKNLVIEILGKLNCDDDYIEQAKIAAILHDIGAIDGKQNHAYRSYEYAKRYFTKNNIKLKNMELILEAIKNHSDGFDTDNLIQLALILSDKLDIKSTRPTKEGLNIPGNRQFGNIEDIHIDIRGRVFEVRFIANKLLDKEELENYYFTKKVGKAIKSFAERFDLTCKVYLNECEWNEIFTGKN